MVVGVIVCAGGFVCMCKTDRHVGACICVNLAAVSCFLKSTAFS